MNESLAQLASGLDRLANSVGFSGAEMLVSLFELAQSHRTTIQGIVKDESDWREVMEAKNGLFRQVVLEPQPHPQPGFFAALRHHTRRDGERSVAVATLAALSALDDAFRACRRKIGPIKVERGDAPGYWLIPLGPESEPPWAADRWGREGGLTPTGWLSSVHLLPMRSQGAALHLARLAREWDIQLAARMEEDETLTIAVSPLSRAVVNGFAPCGPRRQERLEGPLWSVYRLTGQQDVQRLAKLLEERVLEPCRERKASILLFPELTVSPELRALLVEILARRYRESFIADPAARQYPLLIVAGSYHELEPRANRYVNRTLVLDCRGRTVRLTDAVAAGPRRDWVHDKVEKFMLPAGDLAGERLADFRRDLGIDESVAGGVEPEGIGGSFDVVVSSIGRICIAICIDYLRHGEEWRDEVQGAWMDWIWVPSASVRLHDFAAKARSLALAGAGTVVVNACWLVSLFNAGTSGHWSGFAHLPGDHGKWLDENAVQPAHSARMVPAQRPCGEHPCTADSEEGCVFFLEVPRSPSPRSA